MAKHPKRPRDPNQLAKLIADMSVGEVPNDSPKGPDSPAIQARRKGGLRGESAGKGVEPYKAEDDCAEGG